MKTVLAAIILSLAMGLAAEAPAQVRWGVDIHLGTPPPPPPPPLRHEVIIERPYPGAVWVPGYWRFDRPRRHYYWAPGYWRRPAYVYHEYHGRSHWDRDHDHDWDHEHGDRGRIHGGWR